MFVDPVFRRIYFYVMDRLDMARLGYGLGLRATFYEAAARGEIACDWFEVMSENFMEAHPGHSELLADIRRHYPLALHGVAMNIAGVDPMDAYLGKLKSLAAQVRPACISDHLCWTSVDGIHAHDLLPVPYTEEALTHVTARVNRVQDALGQRLVLENPSAYTEFEASTMREGEFLAKLCDATGCGLLLDVNNVYVSAFNQRFDAKAYIDALPLTRVAYVHLAGHRHLGTHIIDTHDDHVAGDVWDLYRYVVGRLPKANTLLEWDGDVPAMDVLTAELGKARDIGQAPS